jgi:hypothetical protein
MMQVIKKMTPPTDEARLQPLREIGTREKTQFWDLDEIYDALRTARRMSLAPETLFSSANTEPSGQAAELAA